MNKERYYHWLGAINITIEDKNGKVIKKIDGLKDVERQLKKDGELKKEEKVNGQG